LVDSEGTAGTFGRSESDPDIPGGRAELSGTPPIPHGGKRKAKMEDREESSSLAKFKYLKNEFDHLSVQEYLKLVRYRTFNPCTPPVILFVPALYIRSSNSMWMNSYITFYNLEMSTKGWNIYCQDSQREILIDLASHLEKSPSMDA